jgi:hypothetical protein
MLTGEVGPWTTGERVALAVLALLFASPLLLMGGGMILVSVLALGPRRDIPELWICLPAGFALLGAFAIALYHALIGVPGRTVTRFCLDGYELVLVTPQLGCFTFPICEVRSVCGVHSRRACAGRKPKGWWLRLEHFGWVYLASHTPNAGLLISRLSMTAREPEAAPATGSDGG